MTRQECEDKLISLMEEANAIYQSFNPQGRHLSMTCIDGQIGVNDANKGADGEYLDFDNGGSTIYVTKLADGTVYRMPLQEVCQWQFS